MFFLPKPRLASKIALNCGTPIPATSLVVQIEPGPIPTLITSTPNLDKNLAASAVAIFPAHRVFFFDFNILIFFIISATFFVWPCAVSTTIKSIFSLSNASAALISNGPAPTAAPTFKFLDLTF